MEDKVKDLEILGDRVVIKLDEAADHTVTEGGIIVSLFEEGVTEGGRPDPRISKKRFLPKGEVVNISAQAQEKLPTVKVGDQVYITARAATPDYQFLPDRSQLVEDWTGLVSVSHVLVEAKIKQ